MTAKHIRIALAMTNTTGSNCAYDIYWLPEDLNDYPYHLCRLVERNKSSLRRHVAVGSLFVTTLLVFELDTILYSDVPFDPRFDPHDLYSFYDDFFDDGPPFIKRSAVNRDGLHVSTEGDAYVDIIALT
jgi:hypothetical protein